jgi:dihydrofolate reductase
VEIAASVVVSLDGKLTRHDSPDVATWASPEEQKQFHELLAKQDSVVMGSGTYEAVKDSLKFDVERLRIVLTSKTRKYARMSMPGKLEFSMETPKQLVKRLGSQGHKNLLVVGGPKMISNFLRDKLINTLYVSVEPRLFGQGKPMISDTPIDVKLSLVKQQKLNTQGTLLLTYTVLT